MIVPSLSALSSLAVSLLSSPITLLKTDEPGQLLPSGVASQLGGWSFYTSKDGLYGIENELPAGCEVDQVSLLSPSKPSLSPRALLMYSLSHLLLLQLVTHIEVPRAASTRASRRSFPSSATHPSNPSRPSSTSSSILTRPSSTRRPSSSLPGGAKRPTRQAFLSAVGTTRSSGSRAGTTTRTGRASSSCARPTSRECTVASSSLPRRQEADSSAGT